MNKTPREILEEALWAVSPGEYKEVRNEIKNMGWVKGSEMITDNGDVDDGQLLAVCSRGAIALASLNKYQLGDIIPKGGWADYDVVAAKDKNTLMAATFLWRAINEYVEAKIKDRNDHRRWWTNNGLHRPELAGYARLTEKDWDVIIKAIKEGRYSRLKSYYSSGRVSRADIEMWTGDDIASFNDDDGTTWEDVIECFKQAIKYAVMDDDFVPDPEPTEIEEAEPVLDEVSG